MLELVSDFFWEEEEVCWCRKQWRGATRGPRGRGRALDPRGQVPAPPPVLSVPNILKYSRKKSYFIFGTFGELLFSGYFLLQGKFRKQTENTIFALFNLNNRK